MSFPADLTTVIVTGRWLNLDQSPASGTVSFLGKYTLSNLVDNTFVIVGKIDAELDVNGQISVVLPAGNDPDWTPAGWTYTVIEQISDRPSDISYSFLLSTADAPTIDLTHVVPIPPVTPVVAYIPLSQKGAANGVATLDVTGNVPLSQLGNAPTGAGVPANAVSSETSFAISPNAGVLTTYSRGDHTHGSPAAPTAASVGADAAGAATAAGNAAQAASVAKALLTTKGDLIVATASATPARIGVGADTFVLTADSAQGSGIKWAAPAGGGGTQLDPGAARLGMIAYSFPPETCAISTGNNLNAGTFVSEPVYLFGTPVTKLGLWVVTEGVTGSGVNVMSIYRYAAGTATLVDSTVDMTGVFSAGPTVYVSANLSAGAFTPTPGIYIITVLTHFSGSNLKIAGTGGLPNVPLINGQNFGGFITGQATPPATFTPATMNQNAGGYFLGAQ